MKDKILTLLSQNISPQITAQTLGCDPSYISQLMADPTFSEQLAAARLTKLTALTARDSKIDAIEDKLLRKIDEAIPLMYKSGELVRAFQIINSAKRRLSDIPQQQQSLQSGAIVQIMLPANSAQALIVNQANNQVVQIGANELVPMQASSLERMLQNVQNSAPRPQNSAQAPSLSYSTEEDI